LRAAVVEAPGRIVVRQAGDPRPGRGEVLIRTAWVSICGSDHHAYRGEFGPRVRFPAVLGHEFCGVVEAHGPDCAGAAPVGSRVVVDPVLHCGTCPACRGGQISSCVNLRLLGIDLPGGFGELVAAPAGSVLPVPDGLPMRLGPLVELTSIACHAAARSRFAPGETVAVFGTGKLGLALVALLAQSAPGRLIGVDLDPARLELAKALGATDVINAVEAEPVAAVRGLTGGHGADLAIEAVGAFREVPGRRPPVTAAVGCLRHGGRALILGQGPGEQPVAWREFVWKEAEIVASRVSRGEFPRALELVASGRMPAARLVSHEMTIGEAPEAFRMLDEGRPGTVKILLRHE
jgi:L-gulonate 5-dehydrogenase